MSKILTTTPANCKVGDFLIVKFPKLNKNNSLVENERAMDEYGSNVENVKILKVVDLPIGEYNRISARLLEDNGDIWCVNGSPVGGHDSDRPEFKDVADPTEVWRNPDLLKLFRDTCYAQGVLVRVEGSPLQHFVVNTEGYGYARYVGRAI